MEIRNGLRVFSDHSSDNTQCTLSAVVARHVDHVLASLLLRNFDQVGCNPCMSLFDQSSEKVSLKRCKRAATIGAVSAESLPGLVKVREWRPT
jgi:hypothetical protein